MLSLLLLLVQAASAGIRDACDGAARTSVGTDVVTVYDVYVDLSWFIWEPGWDGMWTRGLDGHPCLRLGARNHAFLSLVDLDLSGPESGWELQNKLSAAVGTELSWGRVSVGGYLLPGARITVVSQRSRYPEHDIDRSYRAAGVLPSLYLYQATRFWITDRIGVHADLQWSPIYPYREYGWYSNRVLGLGLSLRPQP